MTPRQRRERIQKAVYWEPPHLLEDMTALAVKHRRSLNAETMVAVEEHLQKAGQGERNAISENTID